MYEAFKVDIQNNIAHVVINRPEKVNSLHQKAWDEMKEIFEGLSDNPEVRVVVLSGEGKHFCAGIDVSMLMDIGNFSAKGCEARKREHFIKGLAYLQDCVSSIEKCKKPVIAAIHSGCIGGGVDIATACDMRHCTEDAYFTVKEVDMGLVADIGTMQRLPKVIPYGMAAEMAYTGRKVFGPEAKAIGLANHYHADKETMMEAVMNMAALIASKSPVVIRGTKHILQHTRDHSVNEGLQYIQTWNAAMIYSDDLMESFQAFMGKRAAIYQD